MDAPILFCLGLFKIVICHSDVLTLFVLEALDDILVLDFLAAGSAHLLISYAAAIWTKLVKMNVIVLGSRIQTHGDMHQAKGYSPALGYCHIQTPPLLVCGATTSFMFSKEGHI